MKPMLEIELCQDHFPVGAIAANTEKILTRAANSPADVVVFPELALCGYPPEDLLWQADFRLEVEAALVRLQMELPAQKLVLVGAPAYRDHQIYNALLAFGEGGVLAEYHKQILPNTGVFDDQRYFQAGTQPGCVKWRGQCFGLLICEDIWHDVPVQALRHSHCDQLLVVNASPFDTGKAAGRLKRAQYASAVLQVPVWYVNHRGVQDEIIYDGGSFKYDQGQMTSLGPCFEGSFDAILYKALSFALAGYVNHHHFPGVLLGLSGGVDSALTLAIAADALGPRRVEAIIMPSAYTAQMSIEDAKAEAEALGVAYRVISIETLFETVLAEVSGHFAHPEWDLTEENIQARLRGLILMALSNKSGKMVVTTTNKSELAVGYGTLYGDLAGGFALLKDVYKTQVYALAAYRNQQAAVIPERVLTRAPSAELRENQTDQDALPDYALLDQILCLFQEENAAVAEIIDKLGHEEAVRQVVALIRRNEYKRKQSPVGPKLSQRAFGRDWRMPIMQGMKS